VGGWVGGQPLTLCCFKLESARLVTLGGHECIHMLVRHTKGRHSSLT
jgi:hypothetical protein